MPHASLKTDVTTRVWRHRSRGGRIVRDCAAVLAAFAILAAVIGWNHLPPQPIATRDVLAAGASPAAQEHSTPFIERGTFAVSAAFPLPQLKGGPLAGPTDRILVVATLATVFSAIIAFNVWFLRHLGRVYAFPRPGGGLWVPGEPAGPSSSTPQMRDQEYLPVSPAGFAPSRRRPILVGCAESPRIRSKRSRK